MTSIAIWFSATSLGLPRWGWILLVVFAVIETILGRSSDPRWRSVGDSLRNAAGIVVVPALMRVPTVGPAVLSVLRALKIIPAEPTAEPAKTT